MQFTVPYTAGNQSKYVQHAMQQGFLQDGGPYAMQARQALLRITGRGAALLTSGCSAALDLAFWDMPPGAEVIMPAYNFPAAANAVLRAGGRPVLCDIDPATQNISPKAAAALVTGNTYALCVMHYAGVACDMAALTRLCQKQGLLLVEDAAHALGAYWQGPPAGKGGQQSESAPGTQRLPLGGMGNISCLSFHEGKNIQCGQGGACLFAAEGPAYHSAQIHRDKGTNRAAFLRGETAFYSWEGTGSGLVLSGLPAAMLAAQLEEIESITARRLALWQQYHTLLAPAFAAGQLHAMQVPPYAQHNAHIYYVRAQNGAQQLRLRKALAAQGIPCLTHYVPLHLGSQGRRLGYAPGQFPHSEDTARTLLRLPLWPDMQPGQVEMVCRCVLEALENG